MKILDDFLYCFCYLQSYLIFCPFSPLKREQRVGGKKQFMGWIFEILGKSLSVKFNFF